METNVTVSSATTTRGGVRVQRGEWRRTVVVLIPAAAAASVWLIVCAVGYVLTRPLTARGFTHWEGGADRFFAAHRVGGLNVITDMASLAGDTPAIVGVAAVSFVVLRLTTHRWRCSMALLAAMLGDMHYPTDVLGGMLLGTLWLAVTARVVLRGQCDG